MKVYQVGFADHLRLVRVAALNGGVLVFVGALIGAVASPRVVDALLLVFLGYFVLLYVLPLLPLHVQFMRLNAETRVDLDLDGERIAVTDGNGKLISTFEDISESTWVASRAEVNNSWISPWNGYSFVQLRFASGETRLISSLLIPAEWRAHLPNLKTKAPIYPWPQGEQTANGRAAA